MMCWKNNPLPGHNTGSPPSLQNEIESYLIGGQTDVKKDTFTGFKL